MGCFKSKLIKYKCVQLTQADIDFLLDNTQFDREQIETWFAGFLVDCPKGELSKEKFISAYQKLFPHGDAQRFCEHIFRTFDSDNSGKIDFKEFLLAINITAKGDPRKKLKWAFKLYDIDQNGVIDQNEMLIIIQSIYDLIGDRAQAQMKISSLSSSSSNNNNNTYADNQQQATIQAEKIFNKMDTDKNGVISEEEFIDKCLKDKYLYQMLTTDYSTSIL